MKGKRECKCGRSGKITQQPFWFYKYYAAWDCCFISSRRTRGYLGLINVSYMHSMVAKHRQKKREV